MFTRLIERTLAVRTTGLARLYLVSLLIIINCLFAFPTLAGTAIESQAVTVSIANQEFVSAAPVVLMVQPIYGLSIVPTAEQSVTTDISPVSFVHQVINLGNTTDNIDLSIPASDWVPEYFLLDNTPIVFPLALAAQASLNFVVRYSAVAPSTAAEVLYFSTSQNAAEYTGFNGISYGSAQVLITTDNIYALTLPISMQLQLKALLQGYYDAQTDVMIPAPVIVQFRDVQGVSVTESFSVTVNADGWSDILKIRTVPAGDYYLYVRHANHMAVVTAYKITFVEDVTTVNISEPASIYYNTLYRSSLAQNAPTVLRTESNGLLTIRGGDYNGDNVINIVDWSSFDYEWKSSGVIADFDGNGIIDTRDYGIWLSNNQCYLPLD